jgi:hypothetical protein
MSRGCRNYRCPESLTDSQWASLAARLWLKVDRSGGPDACWPYIGCSLPKGYGRIKLACEFVTQASRATYMLQTRTIPGRWQLVCHRCDNPSCCNPAHLFLGTDQDNKDDMRAKDRHNRGERGGGAKLTADAVRVIRKAVGPGQTQSEVARQFRISQSTVCQIHRRRSWAHLG